MLDVLLDAIKTRTEKGNFLFKVDSSLACERLESKPHLHQQCCVVVGELCYASLI